MTIQRDITVHEIATDGLPPHSGQPGYDDMIGRVAFILDGCVVSGWPLYADNDNPSTATYTGRWEADSDVGRVTEFGGVTHWVEFDIPLWSIHQDGSMATLTKASTR
jgi:hypothetical protein